jgi:phage I-like protein
MSKRLKTKPSQVSLAVAAFAAQTSGEATRYELPVLPAGPDSQPVDGRPTLFHDNAALAAAFNAKGRKIPLDVGHLTMWDGAAPAVGWVTEMFVKEDGSLWGYTELNADGQKLIDGKLFGFTSPTVRVLDVDAGWMVSGFVSLALTNSPALEMSANFSEDTAEEDEAEVATAEAAVAALTSTEATTETAPAAPEAAAALAAEPAADVAALTASVATLTAERDSALAQVASLTANTATLSAQVALFTEQIAALTAERDAARSDLAAFTAKGEADAIQAAIDEANVSGTAYPFEREMLTTYGVSHGLEKLKAYLSARPAFSSTTAATAAPATDVPAEVQAYLARHNLPLDAYLRGRG